MSIVHYISYLNAGASSTLQVTFLWQCTAAAWWCGGHLYEATDSPGHVSTVQVCVRRTSVAVKLNGVDRSGDGSSTVTSPLLLCLFMPERLAFGEPENVVGFLAPVPIGSLLKEQKRKTRCLTVSWLVTLSNFQVQFCSNNTCSGDWTHLCIKRVVWKTGIHSYFFLSDSPEWYVGGLKDKVRLLISPLQESHFYPAAGWVLTHLTFWLALGKVCGVVVAFLFVGVLNSVSSFLFRFPVSKSKRKVHIRKNSLELLPILQLTNWHIWMSKTHWYISLSFIVFRKGITINISSFGEKNLFPCQNITSIQNL